MHAQPSPGSEAGMESASPSVKWLRPPGAAPDTGIAAGSRYCKTPVVLGPMALGSRLPSLGLTCGQGVLLDEVQAAPDEAVERIKRAGYPVQRRHPNLGMPVGEAEDAAGAGKVALLGAGGTQQHPSQQQPSCPHGFGGGERAGGALSAGERAEGHARPRMALSDSARCSGKPA